MIAHWKSILTYELHKRIHPYNIDSEHEKYLCYRILLLVALDCEHQ
jgi:hypothetical protein